jgi:hypothetical protein
MLEIYGTKVCLDAGVHAVAVPHGA